MPSLASRPCVRSQKKPHTKSLSPWRIGIREPATTANQKRLCHLSRITVVQYFGELVGQPICGRSRAPIGPECLFYVVIGQRAISFAERYHWSVGPRVWYKPPASTGIRLFSLCGLQRPAIIGFDNSTRQWLPTLRSSWSPSWWRWWRSNALLLRLPSALPVRCSRRASVLPARRAPSPPPPPVSPVPRAPSASAAHASVTPVVQAHSPSMAPPVSSARREPTPRALASARPAQQVPLPPPAALPSASNALVAANPRLTRLDVSPALQESTLARVYAPPALPAPTAPTWVRAHATNAALEPKQILRKLPANSASLEPTRSAAAAAKHALRANTPPLGVPLHVAFAAVDAFRLQTALLARCVRQASTAKTRAHALPAPLAPSRPTGVIVTAPPAARAAAATRPAPSASSAPLAPSRPVASATNAPLVPLRRPRALDRVCCAAVVTRPTAMPPPALPALLGPSRATAVSVSSALQARVRTSLRVSALSE